MVYPTILTHIYHTMMKQPALSILWESAGWYIIME